MGKTDSVAAGALWVEDDNELNSRYSRWRSPREQYNVNRLHHFLLNALDALADAMERLQNDRMRERVEAQAKLLGHWVRRRLNNAYRSSWRRWQEMGRSFSAARDNADRLFDTIEDKDSGAPRFYSRFGGDLTLFRSDNTASDGNLRNGARPSFEFFQIHRLTPLTLEEVRNLLLQLSESVRSERARRAPPGDAWKKWLARRCGRRLRTLVQLTGGNPAHDGAAGLRRVLVTA